MWLNCKQSLKRQRNEFDTKVEIVKSCGAQDSSMLVIKNRILVLNQFLVSIRDVC